MLRPEYLEGLPDEILELFAEAEREILADMARRISTYDFWIPAADYQNEKLREAGVLQNDIIKALSHTTRKSEEELRTMMKEAGSMALHSDESIYKAAGLSVPSIKDSQPLTSILNAGYRATATEMKNLCRTTAQTATKQFEDALDRAWLKVSSGAFDSESAIRSAVKELSEKGVQSIRYPSGHTDSIETAVRRAIVTGVNQTAAKLQDELADELGCDLVEVTAHSGARPEHAVWQGKIYSRSGNDPKYPPFRQSTGYGTGAGLCGWNCGHSFGPYIEGSPPVWTEEQLAELNAPKYEYNGKKLTEYEASQQQRYNERQIRRWKREYTAMEAAGLDTAESAVKLKHWQAVQDDFLSKTGFGRQYGREMTAGFGRNQAAAAHAQAEEFYKDWSKSIGANDAIKTLAKYYDVKYNDSPRYELLKRYVQSVKSGRMSPMSHFDLYEEYHRRIQSEVVGKTVGGVTISGQTAHFLERVFGTMCDPKTGLHRNGVSLEEIQDCIANPVGILPVKTDVNGRRSFVVVGRTAKVSISADSGLLIQTNPRRE